MPTAYLPFNVVHLRNIHFPCLSDIDAFLSHFTLSRYIFLDNVTWSKDRYTCLSSRFEPDDEFTEHLSRELHGQHPSVHAGAQLFPSDVFLVHGQERNGGMRSTPESNGRGRQLRHQIWGMQGVQYEPLG